MTKVLTSVLICFLLLVMSVKNDDFSPDKIIAMEKAALDRWGKGDPQGYLEIMDDDLTYFDPFLEKRLDGLSAMKEFIKPYTGKIKVDRFDMLNPKVQRDGNMAVLTFNLLDHGATFDGVDQGAPHWSSTEVFRQVDGRWKIIHSHWSYAKVDTPTDAETLQALHVEWAKAFAVKDLDAIVNHYADDAYVEMSNKPIIKGKAAIRAQMKQALTDPNFALTFVPNQVEVSKGADLGYVRGTYVVTSLDPITKRPKTSKGKYIVIYKRDSNGQWKAIHDINNRDS